MILIRLIVQKIEDRMKGIIITMDSAEASVVDQIENASIFLREASVGTDDEMTVKFDFIESALDFLCLISEYANESENTENAELIDSVADKIWRSCKKWLTGSHGQLIVDLVQDSKLS